jgi:CheY-like chemotaxis protein
MPNISGFDLVKSIRNYYGKKPQPIVLALTANNINDNPDFYKEAGFDGVLIKPFYEIQLYNLLAPFVNQQPMEFTPPEEDNLNGHGLLYDISDIHRFADGDSESARLILKTFMDNATTNLANLKELSNQKDWKRLKEVSHRMKSGFRQFKIYGIAETLENLENANFDNVEEQVVSQTLDIIQDEVEKIHEMLKVELEKL